MLRRLASWFRSWLGPAPAPHPDLPKDELWCDCPNCTRAYPSSETHCPACGADHRGAGARVHLDEEARRTIARLGGMTGDVRVIPAGGALLVCERGIARVQTGLADATPPWTSGDLGLVQDVEMRDGRAWITTEDGTVCLGLDDGQPV